MALGVLWTLMDKVEFETTVYAPRSDVYDFLVEFENYGRYSDKIDDVTVVGDDPLEWEISVSWWLLSYTARSAVTQRVENQRIDWEITKDVDAWGSWILEDTESEDRRYDDATRVVLEAEYDPEHADRLSSLPTSKLVSLAKPVVIKEGRRVLRRVVGDLEGRRRNVDLNVRHVES